jgi:hypothetical protein
VHGVTEDADGPSLSIRTVGPPHIHGSARIEDSRPSFDLGLRGAWAATEEAGGATLCTLCGSYSIPRIGNDPEFAGGIGPLGPELAVDGEGGQADGGASRLARVKARLPAALGGAVEAAVHAGLEDAAAGARA